MRCGRNGKEEMRGGERGYTVVKVCIFTRYGWVVTCVMVT